MRSFFKILSHIFALFLIVMFILIAIYNNGIVNFKIMQGLELKQIPLFLVVLISFIFGSITNFIFLILNKRR